jgi:hypothetical protein
LGINEVKKIVIACAAMALFGSAAQAAEQTTAVGDWVVTSVDSAFDDGGNAAIIAGIPGFFFAVRCQRKSPNFSIMLSKDKLTEGQLFHVKLRVDRGDIIEVDGISLDEHLIQAENNFAIWKALPGGKEMSVRVENQMGVSQTQSFMISGAAKALPTVTRECPITDETAASGEKK